MEPIPSFCVFEVTVTNLDNHIAHDPGPPESGVILDRTLQDHAGAQASGCAGARGRVAGSKQLLLRRVTQATQGARWMPWCQGPKKDAAGGERVGEVPSNLRSGHFRMGQPTAGHTAEPTAESIGGAEASLGTETSQYQEETKSTEIPLVVASERGTAQTARA